MYQRALEVKERVWGPEHELTIYTVRKLLGLYLTQNKIKEAESMYWRTPEGKEKHCRSKQVSV